jgi:hypothetical protein
VRGVISPGTELDDGVNKQAEDENENERADFENEVGQMIDDIGGSGMRLKDIGDGIFWRRGDAQSRGEEESREKDEDGQGTAQGTCAVRIALGSIHFRLGLPQFPVRFLRALDVSVN